MSSSAEADSTIDRGFQHPINIAANMGSSEKIKDRTHDDTPRTKVSYDDSLKGIARKNSIKSKDNQHSSLKRIDSRDSISSIKTYDSNHYNIRGGNMNHTNKAKRDRGSQILKRTLSTLSLSKSNQDGPESTLNGKDNPEIKYPTDTMTFNEDNRDHHYSHITTRKPSFAGTLFKTLSNLTGGANAGSSTHLQESPKSSHSKERNDDDYITTSRVANYHKPSVSSIGSHLSMSPASRKASKDSGTSKKAGGFNQTISSGSGKASGFHNTDHSKSNDTSIVSSAEGVPTSIKRKVSSLVKGSNILAKKSGKEGPHSSNRSIQEDPEEGTNYTGTVKRDYRRTFLLTPNSSTSSRRGSVVSSIASTDSMNFGNSRIKYDHHTDKPQSSALQHDFVEARDGNIDALIEKESEQHKNEKFFDEGSGNKPAVLPSGLFHLDTNLSNLEGITKEADKEKLPMVSGTTKITSSNDTLPMNRKSVSDRRYWVASGSTNEDNNSMGSDPRPSIQAEQHEVKVKQPWRAPESWDVELGQKDPSTDSAAQEVGPFDVIIPEEEDVLAPTFKKPKPKSKSRRKLQNISISRDDLLNHETRTRKMDYSSMTSSRPSNAHKTVELDSESFTSATETEGSDYSSAHSPNSTSGGSYSSDEDIGYHEDYSDKKFEDSDDLKSKAKFTKSFSSSADLRAMNRDNLDSSTILALDDERRDQVEYELEKYYKDFSDLDGDRHYAIRVFNIDDTFTTLSCTPNTTVEEMIPALKRKFNITSQGNFQISLKVGKLSKILRPVSKPILIERKLLLLNGYRKSDPLHILGIEDLSFVFKFLFHPVTPSHFTPEQEERIVRGEFVHVDLRNMDLTTPPIVLYQHTSEIETLDVSNNANIFLPLEFVQSAINLFSLRMVNIRASRFPINITEASKLITLELQRNFIRKVPSTISNLKSLTILNLQCNSLDKLPRGFGALVSLQLLDLSSNRFFDFPEVINNLTDLLQVDLSYNKIHNIPSSINNLEKLAKMNLSHNKITSVGNLSGMKSLRTLNLRYNRIGEIGTNAQNLQHLFLTDNRISTFEDKLPRLRALEMQENPITSLSFRETYPSNMTTLSLSKAKLASLPGELFTKLVHLEKLDLSKNNLTRLPTELSLLSKLVYLSVARNKLEFIPFEFSSLRSLRILDLHSNNIRAFFDGMQSIELTYLNISSNVFGGDNLDSDFYRKIVPESNLAKSLLFLIAADNQFDDASWPLFNCFTKLKTLNLSYNNFTDVSELKLEELNELYLSGNKLTNLSSDTVLKLKTLKTLLLNGNQLLSLPAELSGLNQLSVLDVGSNQLKYNIFNHHYDWNWRNNKELKYLNFSGNRRFEIREYKGHESNVDLSDFTVLPSLRILGLMDVTLDTAKVPDEGINFRLRTTASIINGMRYGVADTMGQREFVCTRDVTFERFRGKDDESLLCLHDGKNPNADYGHNISRIVRDIYDKIMIRQLEKYGDIKDEDIKTALRFSFLQLNKEINGMLNSVDNGTNLANLSSADLLCGACSTVIYIKGTKVFAANLGDCMAVLCKNNGDHIQLTQQHLPTKREDYERIRISGGYVNNGKLDGVVEVSRAVGFFDLLPHIYASPEITMVTLTHADDMLIVATNKLWEYMDIETACDIARENSAYPMLAAEKMKDHAIAYGCSDNLTILCLRLHKNLAQQDRFTLNKTPLMTRRTTVEDTTLRRLQPEIAPPTGNVAMFFTDIKNSTFLWELFPNAMRTAIKTHNDIMRRQLRIFGGYEVKTEGDAFMVAFPTPTSALVWCLSVQLKLLDAQWPEEITSIQDGCTVVDKNGTKIYHGLSVRMGGHWGCPVPELDLVTQRMDYLGPMVNKSSRVSSVADGGQVTLSSDFIAEFNKIMRYHEKVIQDHEELESVYGEKLVGEVIEREIAMLESIGWTFFEYGEQKLKGLETKEFITIAYPKVLASRHEYITDDEQSRAINLDILVRLKTISNKLQSILSAVGGGAVDFDARSNATKQKVQESLITSISESDIIVLLDHLVMSVESSVALLQLRQNITPGLEICSTCDNNCLSHMSIFSIVDQAIKLMARQ